MAGACVHRNDQVLVAMRDALTHRGPDDAGLWWSPRETVGLGHRRLSIVDLSAAGHQPMLDDSGKLAIVFNGEIYNFIDLRKELVALGHRFRSGTDTEVILHAYRQWGTECLSRLNGMFAFALHDLDSDTLLLARDRAGEKPLFYRIVDGMLAFGSEVKALMADPTMPRRLDHEAFEYYLAYGYVPRDMCMLAGVRKLPQGSALSYRVGDGHTRKWEYWSLPEQVPIHGSESDLIDELSSLLHDSVRRQLVADVPVGVLLSGGLDSSLVTAIAARESSVPVKTYTITFPENPTYNEAPYARVVANHFGTHHTELEAAPATIDLLPLLARQYDEPIADSSMIPTFLVSQLIRRHATVALGGDGGDELFGGYTRYSWILQQEHLRPRFPAWLRNTVASSARTLLPVGLPGRTYLASYGGTMADSVAHLGIYFDAGARRWLRTGRRSSGTPSPEALRRSLLQRGGTPIQQLTSADYRTYMVDDILVKVDRASMLNSLEVRAPFLDYRIIEFAFSQVPDNLRATRGSLKVLPKLLGKRLLPAQLDIDRKQGFSIPLKAWLKGPWGEYFSQVLSEADPSILNRRSLRTLFNRQGRFMNNSERLYSLTLFELWRREYGVTA